MKLILLFAVGAFAVQDSAPPVISLNLAGVPHTTYSTIQTARSSAATGRIANCAFGAKSATDATCADGTSMPSTHTANSMTGSSFARKCGVGDTDGQTNCPSPSSYAYDHNEGALNNKIQVGCTKFVVSEPNKLPERAASNAKTCALADANGACTTGSQCKLANSEYSQRGEDVLVYSVTDASKNAAEKLVFAMIIEDQVPPTLMWNQAEATSPRAHTSAMTVESCLDGNTQSSRCTYTMQGIHFVFDDNVDSEPHTATIATASSSNGLDSATATDIKNTAGAQTDVHGHTAGIYSSYISDKAVDTTTVGQQHFRYTVTDWADIFGQNNVDNSASADVLIEVKDSKRPRVQLKPVAGAATVAKSVCSTTAVTDSSSGTAVSINSIAACREYNRHHVVPLPVAGTAETVLSGSNYGSRAACAGCVGSNCYTAGTTKECTPADLTTTKQTIECNWNKTLAVTAGQTTITWDQPTNHTHTAGNFASTGAFCTDDRLSADGSGENTNDFNPASISTNKDVDVGTVADYTATYTCTDSINTQTALRTITVQDTTPPTVLTSTQGREGFRTDYTGLYEAKAGDGMGAGTCKRDENGDLIDANCKALDKTTVGAGAGFTADTSSTAHTGSYAAELKKLTKIQWSAGFHGAGGESDEALALLENYGSNGGYMCTDLCYTEWTTNANAWTKGLSNAGHASMWVKCKDSTDAAKDCCEAYAASSDSAFQGGKTDTTFNSQSPGKWALLYVCNDGHNDPQEQCRAVTVEDHTKPIITILGSNIETVEASKEENYVDQGADCYDQVDQNIADKVQVSGDVVNLSRVGTYKITYSCEDSAGNAADPMDRIVNVRDTTCPVCKFANDADKSLTLEAGFKYTDGARFACDGSSGHDLTCSDAYLGNCLPATVKARTWTKGDVALKYDTSAGLATMSSTGVMTSTYGLATVTGTYMLQYAATDETGNLNYGNQLDEGDTGKCNNAPSPNFNTAADYTRYVTVVDTLRPVIKLTLTEDGKTNEVQVGTAASKQTDAVTGVVTYSKTAMGAANIAKQTGVVTDAVTGVESDVSITDAHINALHLGSKFMSEQTQTSVNGWVLGAIASAVSGLALLGYSLRKQTQPVATSVPV